MDKAIEGRWREWVELQCPVGVDVADVWDIIDVIPSGQVPAEGGTGGACCRAGDHHPNSAGEGHLLDGVIHKVEAGPNIFSAHCGEKERAQGQYDEPAPTNGGASPLTTCLRCPTTQGKWVLTTPPASRLPQSWVEAAAGGGGAENPTVKHVGETTRPFANSGVMFLPPLERYVDLTVAMDCTRKDRRFSQVLKGLQRTPRQSWPNAPAPRPVALQEISLHTGRSVSYGNSGTKEGESQTHRLGSDGQFAPI